jgi:hypothetical protein
MTTDEGGSGRVLDLSQFVCVGDDEGPCKRPVVVTLTGYRSHYVTAGEFAPLWGHHARLHREDVK